MTNKIATPSPNISSLETVPGELGGLKEQLISDKLSSIASTSSEYVTQKASALGALGETLAQDVARKDPLKAGKDLLTASAIVGAGTMYFGQMGFEETGEFILNNKGKYALGFAPLALSYLSADKTPLNGYTRQISVPLVNKSLHDAPRWLQQNITGGISKLTGAKGLDLAFLTGLVGVFGLTTLLGVGGQGIGKLKNWNKSKKEKKTIKKDRLPSGPRKSLLAVLTPGNDKQELSTLFDHLENTKSKDVKMSVLMGFSTAQMNKFKENKALSESLFDSANFIATVGVLKNSDTTALEIGQRLNDELIKHIQSSAVKLSDADKQTLTEDVSASKNNIGIMSALFETQTRFSDLEKAERSMRIRYQASNKAVDSENLSEVPAKFLGKIFNKLKNKNQLFNKLEKGIVFNAKSSREGSVVVTDKVPYKIKLESGKINFYKNGALLGEIKSVSQ